MLIFLGLAILSLWYLPLLFAPLYLFLYIFLLNKPFINIWLLVFSLFYDLFWVLPLGSTGLFLSIYLLIIFLYGQKFNVYNQIFLFVIISLASCLAIWIFNLTPTNQIFFGFSMLFLVLSFKMRTHRLNSLFKI